MVKPFRKLNIERIIFTLDEERKELSSII